MSISNVISGNWRYFLTAFDADDRQTLLESLCDAYHAEVDMVASCTQHAHRMFYPQFRAELLRIASEARAHLPWLQAQILALGGRTPSDSPAPTSEGNSWECLRRGVEEARRDCARLLEWIHRAEREEPVIAEGLQRIRQDKLRHREEFRQMFMKSDPYTIATTGPPRAHEAQRKHTWLEQRKNEWMDHERAAWEIEGKQTPWAEWSGEQEFRWMAELPHHDRAWTQYLAEQRDIEMP